MDSGLYRCTAINEWGHRHVEFRLEVISPPISGSGNLQEQQQQHFVLAPSAGTISAIPALSAANAVAAASAVPRIEQQTAQTLQAGNTAQLLCRVEWHNSGSSGQGGFGAEPVIRASCFF